MKALLRYKGDGWRIGGFESVLERVQIELKKGGNEVTVERIEKSNPYDVIIKFGKKLNDKAKDLVKTTNHVFGLYVKAFFTE